MKKLKKLAKSIRNVIKQPSLLNLVIEREEDWYAQLIAKHPSFNKGLPIIPLSELANNNPLKVQPYSFLDGGSLPTDLGLLALLAQRQEVDSYFEIGTWRGESVANVSPFVKECFTLNLSAQELKSMGKTNAYINMHRFYSRDLQNVHHIEGNSLTYNFESLNQQFDLIFIDGDHHYTGVKNDTKRVFETLVHENSIVVWHDYAFNPERVRSEVFLGILDGIPNDKKQHLFHISNTMCAVYFPFNTNSFSKSEMTYPLTPSQHISVNINFN